MYPAPRRRLQLVAHPSSPWQHVSVLAVSLAVCLLLLLTTMRLPQPEDGGQVVVQPVAEPAVAVQLAEIWSATRPTS